MANTEQVRDANGVTIRESVIWFARVMEWTLRANDSKGHWRNCKMLYLRRRLRNEMGELFAVLSAVTIRQNRERDHGLIPMTDAELTAIISEASDVANFAHMIADNARQAHARKVAL